MIHISSCIDASKRGNRALTAEEKATAALSAMLGLGKPKARARPKG